MSSSLLRYLTCCCASSRKEETPVPTMEAPDLAVVPNNVPAPTDIAANPALTHAIETVAASLVEKAVSQEAARRNLPFNTIRFRPSFQKKLAAVSTMEEWTKLKEIVSGGPTDANRAAADVQLALISKHVLDSIEESASMEKDATVADKPLDDITGIQAREQLLSLLREISGGALHDLDRVDVSEKTPAASSSRSSTSSSASESNSGSSQDSDTVSSDSNQKPSSASPGKSADSVASAVSADSVASAKSAGSPEPPSTEMAAESVQDGSAGDQAHAATEGSSDPTPEITVLEGANDFSEAAIEPTLVEEPSFVPEGNSETGKGTDADPGPVEAPLNSETPKGVEASEPVSVKRPLATDLASEPATIEEPAEHNFETAKGVEISQPDAAVHTTEPVENNPEARGSRSIYTDAIGEALMVTGSATPGSSSNSAVEAADVSDENEDA